MNKPNSISREDLTKRAEQLKNQINDYMSNGRVFGEVKKIYQDYKQVLEQLQHEDINRSKKYARKHHA